jgi:unsaturated rhamnogalacturonyl hydrolase
MTRKIPFVALFALACCGITTAATTKTIVAMDCYHNNETTPHYLWAETDLGGYSQYAVIVRANGGDTMSIKTAMDSTVLAPVDVLIMSDPDTPTESANPKYVTAAEADALDKWVQRGGILMLLSNNVGNCEFTNFNVLANKFGITFNQDTYANGPLLTGLPNHPFFTNCDTLNIVDMCTQTIISPAQSVYAPGGKVLISTSSKGKGTVFALGDPWMYNEHIVDKDNKVCSTNVLKWLFTQIPTPVIHRVQGSSAISSPRISSRAFLPNGRAVAGSSSRQAARSRVIVSKSPASGKSAISIER